MLHYAEPNLDFQGLKHYYLQPKNFASSSVSFWWWFWWVTEGILSVIFQNRVETSLYFHWCQIGTLYLPKNCHPSKDAADNHIAISTDMCIYNAWEQYGYFNHNFIWAKIPNTLCGSCSDFCNSWIFPGFQRCPRSYSGYKYRWCISYEIIKSKMQKSYFSCQRFAGFGQNWCEFSVSEWEIWYLCTNFRHKFNYEKFVSEQKKYPFENIGFGGHR